MSTPAVEFRSVSKRYGAVTALDTVSFAIERGTLVTLLGPSGCGKTTILRLIAGLEQASDGRILIDGDDVTLLSAAERDVSMVFQSYALFPHMTVLENVCYGLRASGMRKAQAVELAQAKLTLVGLAGYGARLPSELSGGQQQRVAVARAIVLEPKVLLFDEPLSNLDAKLRRHVREEIHELQQSLSLTAVYVTHDQQEALAISDRIMVMSMARIAQDGTPRGLYEQPNSHFVADFIGDANIVPVTIESRQGEMASVRLGPLQLTLPHHGAVEGAAELSIRPHAVRLAPGGRRADRTCHQGGLSRQPHGVLGRGRRIEQGVVRRRPRGRSTIGGRGRRCHHACPHRRRTRPAALTAIGLMRITPRGPSGRANPMSMCGRRFPPEDRMADTYPVTSRNRLRRRHERGHYDRDTVHAILDAAMLCHIAYVIDGQPFCTPTSFWREGDRLYWHGSSASRMVRAQAKGLPVCLTVTHHDAVVLARSGFHHSVNYRCVMAYGQARAVTDPAAKLQAMDAFIDRFYPGRAAVLRPPTSAGDQGDHHSRDGDRGCRGEDPRHRRLRRGGGLRGTGLVCRAAAADCPRRAGGMPAPVAGRHAGRRRHGGLCAGTPVRRGDAGKLPQGVSGPGRPRRSTALIRRVRRSDMFRRELRMLSPKLSPITR